MTLNYFALHDSRLVYAKYDIKQYNSALEVFLNDIRYTFYSLTYLLITVELYCVYMWKQNRAVTKNRFKS